MRKVLAFVLLCFFISGTFLTVFSSVSTSDSSEASWSSQTSMNDPRSDLGVVVVEGKIYAIGGGASVASPGSVGRGFVGINECYDPVSDTWIVLKSMPTPRGNFIIVTCQGKIYCIGGADGTIYPLGPPVLRPLDIVEVYDPATDMWESKASLPIYVQQSMQVQVVNEQIFIITPDGELYMYNTLTDKWSTKAHLTNQEKPLQSLVINEQLFVITQNAMYLYDPTTDSWITTTNMPTSMVYAFSDVMDNKIIVGDFLLTPSTEPIWMGLFSAQLQVRIYDPTVDVWYDGETTDECIFATNPIFMAVTVTMTSGVYAPANVYVLGLKATKENLMNVQPFTWVYDPESDVWSTAKIVDTAPYSRGCKLVVVDDVFYIIGGAVNVKYIPVGYNPQGYHDAQPSALTWSIEIATVLIVGIVIISLFFYLRKKRRKRRKYD
ncbi:MAG: hypothetical protein FWD52_08800 [Candidatus Bathyarchaeota archaeon]|nr:hypothetical protein [Candidatus Termiticorpusculum sp.]